MCVKWISASGATPGLRATDFDTHHGPIFVEASSVEPASPPDILLEHSHLSKMRRRKKDKTQQDKASTSSTDHDRMDSSGRAGSSSTKSSKQDADASANGVTVTVSPPQQRRRTLLGGLGSMRDLVEQVSMQGSQVTVEGV